MSRIALIILAMSLAACAGNSEESGASLGLLDAEQEYSVDPRATYLRTIWDRAESPTVISLADAGIVAGDTVVLRRIGSFKKNRRRSADGMAAVFSASADLLPNPYLFGDGHRVPDAIDAGESVFTPKTFFFRRPTDIDEDFEVTGEGVELLVPGGATHLLVTSIDDYFKDNKSNDFAIGITLVRGEPSLCDGVECDNSDPCLQSACNPLNGRCEASPANEGGSCDFSGLPGLCRGGICVDADLCAGVECSTDSECTTSACDPLNGGCPTRNVPDGTECDAGGIAGACSGGTCVATDLCDGKVCDDGNTCTTNACDPLTGGCSSSNVVDGTGCDFNGAPGACRGGLCEDANLCQGVSCDDGNECTVGACDPLTGGCSTSNVADGTSCDFDGLPGICSSGTCEDAKLCQGVSCDDGNECTSNSCDPLDASCETVNVADGTSCNFGGLPGTCMNGGCQDAQLCAGVDCSTGNECTTGACDPLSGACNTSNVADGTSCDFGGLPGLCASGVCEDAQLCLGASCSDTACTVGACDPATGDCFATNVTDGTSCNFGGLPGVCTAGVCEDAQLCAGVTCDDGNQCTTQVCDPQDGSCPATNVADGTSCNFGALPGVCTAGVCEDAQLCAGVDCSTGNQCTTGACDPLTGDCNTSNVADGTSCDFGGLPGVCNAGACEDANLCAGVDCSTGNECTAGACDPLTGGCSTSNVADGTSCDFGGLPGVCNTGVCEDAQLCAGVDCSTGNECSTGACDPLDGSCSFANLADGTACSIGSCSAGSCVPTTPDPASTFSTIDCVLPLNLGNAIIDLDVSLAPSSAWNGNGSTVSVDVLATTTIPASLGQLLVGLGTDQLTLDSIAAVASVSGGSPDLNIALPGQTIDVDLNNDGTAEDINLVIPAGMFDITSDGSPVISIEVTHFEAYLSNVPLLGTLVVSETTPPSSIACTLSSTPVAFAAN